MGRDKAGIVVGSMSMGQRAVVALRGAGMERVVVVGGTENFGAEHLADEIAGAGPLGGLCTAAAALPGHLLVVLPCDLPRIDAFVVQELLEGFRGRTGAPVAVGVVAGRRAWPISVWRPTALAAAGQAFAAGVRSFRALEESLEPVEIALDDRARDADVPGDLQP